MTHILNRLINLRLLFSALGKSSACRKSILALTILAFIGTCGFGLLAVSKNSYQKIEDVVVRALDWRINNIDVRVAGTEKIDIGEIIDQAGLEEGAYINRIRWASLTEDLKKNPRIQNATIIRPAPDKVIIMITPSNIIARINEHDWHDNKTPLVKRQSVLIDQAGQKIRVTPREQDKALIGISGRQVFDHVDQFWGLLMAEPSIAQNTDKIELVGKRRWDITLRNGVMVKLPERETGLALRRLSMMIDDRMVDMASVTVIDLRAHDRAFVEYKKDKRMIDAAQG